MTTKTTGVPQQARRSARTTRAMTLHRLVQEIGINDSLDCLTQTCREEVRPKLVERDVADCQGWLVHARPPDAAPGWVADLRGLTGFVFDEDFTGSQPGSLLFVEVDDRVYVVSFGSGWLWLDDAVKDQTFGLSLAIRCMNPADVSDIVRRSPGRRGRMDATQMPGGSPLWGFGMDTVSEMVRKLNGRTFDLPLTYSREGERAPKLEAAGSLCTHLGLTPEAFVADIRILAAVLRDRPVAPEFAFVDNVKEVTFPETRDGLNEVLTSALTSAPHVGESVSLAVPTDLLDAYASAGAFQIRLDGGSWMTPRIELEIAWIRQLLNRIGQKGRQVQALMQGKVRMLASTGPGAELLSADSSLMRWLEASVSIGSHRYALLEGRWYELGADYLDNLQQDTSAFFADFSSDLVLPQWRRKAKGIETEREYNDRVGMSVSGLVTMDRAFVRGRADRPWQLEVCDLLADDGTLIHVKPAAGSDVLSHLFNQALVSAEALMQREVREQFIRLAAERGVNLPDGWEPQRVVVAIMLKNGQTLSEETLFPFAQLALRHAARTLNRRGIRLEVAGIHLSSTSAL